MFLRLRNCDVLNHENLCITHIGVCNTDITHTHKSERNKPVCKRRERKIERKKINITKKSNKQTDVQTEE